MTNLHNYRDFTIRLKEELNRARRNNTKVSLLILDIDHFKNYNDTLGHQAGDEALRVLGKVIKSTVRDEDVVSRYGGEEFCIILPGSSKESMKKLGERVRQQVEVHKFYKEKVAHVPAELFRVLDQQRERLLQARKNFGDYISPESLEG